MSAVPEMTVIIPTFNQRELLTGCLRSLKSQTSPCQVLVVDNGSSDSTSEMMETQFPDFQLLKLSENQGFARAVNQGLRRVHTPYLALLNNDTEVDPHWVEAGLQAFSKYPEIWFFACKMVNFYERTVLDSAGDGYSRTGLPFKRGMGAPAAAYSEAEAVLGASAGAAFYRRELFQEVGLFDESYFMYLEDVDLSLRAQLAGRRCVYLPDAIVFHIEAASDPQRVTPAAPAQTFYSPSRVFWITRNRWLLMCTYLPFWAAPWLAYGWLRSTLFHVLKAGFTASFLRGLLAGIRLTPQAARKRLRLRKRRVLSQRELWNLLQAC